MDAADDSSQTTTNSTNGTILNTSEPLQPSAEVNNGIAEEEGEDTTNQSRVTVDDSILMDESNVGQEPAAESVEAVAGTSIVLTKMVKIDTEQLDKLLDSLAAKTKDYTLQPLLRLYSKLGRIVNRYSKVWDRNQLLLVITL